MDTEPVDSAQPQVAASGPVAAPEQHTGTTGGATEATVAPTTSANEQKVDEIAPATAETHATSTATDTTATDSTPADVPTAQGEAGGSEEAKKTTPPKTRPRFRLFGGRSSPKLAGEDASSKDTNDDAPESAVEAEPKKDSPKRIGREERVQIYAGALQRDVLSWTELTELSMVGIPDNEGLRSTYWKVLLGYLPLDRASWDDVIARNRETYLQFKEELYVDPHETSPQDDHPLNSDAQSPWQIFFENNQLIAEIDKDVRRTLPDMHFFNNLEDKPTEHHDSLRRMLFIYAKLNAGVKYVQGMNEIMAPIYYVFSTDPVGEDRDTRESAVFFCFQNLMARVRDNFISTLDKSADGIQARMKAFNSLLEETDNDVWAHMKNEEINPQFYSFRWLTLMLTQEFELPDLLRLWDSLFTGGTDMQFLYFMCAAMIRNVRDQILATNFAGIIKLLQKYPPIDVNHLISLAVEIRKEVQAAGWPADMVLI
eukprot:GFYU01008500.1.p1 GENE.GFYU01008500.1~~GFYU01008500.1.p1  ORF type:complete len:484 (+),score=104.27 GFYU01008500.1:72-1523(+)